MDNPSVTIIILNWNGWEDTVECLESIYQISYPNYHVIVVDNNSTDDSIKKITNYAIGNIDVKSKFFNYDHSNKPIKILNYNQNEYCGRKPLKNDHELILIKNESNSGFAEGNNIGIKYALKNLNPNYILLLNNDTVVEKNFLMSLIREGEKDSKIGLLGPKMYYYDNPNVLWCIGGKINWKLARGMHIGKDEIDTGQYNEKRNFDYINGSALLIKKRVIEDIGLLDKKFFLYFEEVDLALRASKKKYDIEFVPKSKIWHKVSKSGGGIKKEIGLYYITRNRWIFMKKWANRFDFIIFVVIQIFVAIVLPILLSIYYNNRKLFSAYYNGLWDGLRIKL